MGVTCNKPIRASSHIPFKSRALVPWRIAIMTADLPGARQRELSGMRQSNKCPSWPGGDVAAASRAHLLKSGEDCCSHGAWASKRTTCSCCAPSSSPTPSPSTRSTRSASRITPGPDSAGVSNPTVVQHHVSLSPLIFPHLCHQHIHDSWKCCVKHNKPQRMLRLFEDCTVKCLLTYPNT